MVKFYEGHFSVCFSWDQVAQAFWRRYPNPYSNHVLSEDVVCRRVVDGKLLTKRLLSKTNHVPEWGKRFFNSRAIYIIEESIVDPNGKTIVTYTRNIGFSKIMTVEEKCIYSSKENQQSTIVRNAHISSEVFGFSRAIQSFGLERFRKNSIKASRGFQHVLEAMFGAEKNDDIVHSSALPLLDRSKLKETAKKATELAKSRAKPLVAAAAACNNNNTQTS